MLPLHLTLSVIHCQARAAADAGDSAAQVQTAALLEKGVGVKQDLVAAAGYYQKAADQGSPAGMSGMGVLLRFGRGGIKKDTAAAARSGRRCCSCAHGSWFASYRVSCARLFAAAAQEGDAIGQVNLGDLHYYGAGVKKDWAMTFKLCGARAMPSELLARDGCCVQVHTVGRARQRAGAEQLGVLLPIRPRRQSGQG